MHHGGCHPREGTPSQACAKGKLEPRRRPLARQYDHKDTYPGRCVRSSGEVQPPAGRRDQGVRKLKSMCAFPPCWTTKPLIQIGCPKSSKKWRAGSDLANAQAATLITDRSGGLRAAPTDRELLGEFREFKRTDMRRLTEVLTPSSILLSQLLTLGDSQ